MHCPPDDDLPTDTRGASARPEMSESCQRHVREMGGQLGLLKRMLNRRHKLKIQWLLAISFCTSSLAFPQTGHAAPEKLPTKTTLPIVFTQSFDANHVHTGDIVHAKTTQPVSLPNGISLPSGADVTGHVIVAAPFSFDKTPYAAQKQSVLSVRFDTVSSGSVTIPLNVYVRAIADPITSWDARKPGPSDLDPLGTVTQVGGDILVPSQKEVRSPDGDIVGYNRSSGVYAHLIAASGCDGSDTEQPMGLFAASACGLYGFAGTTLQQTGKAGDPSTLVLTSNRSAPKIWKHSTALLEVLPQD
jgi:hypothetical protein